jgi:hypothetical protein
MLERRIQIAGVGDPFKTVKNTEFRVSFRVPRGFPPPAFLFQPVNLSSQPILKKKALCGSRGALPLCAFLRFSRVTPPGMKPRAGRSRGAAMQSRNLAGPAYGV